MKRLRFLTVAIGVALALPLTAQVANAAPAANTQSAAASAPISADGAGATFTVTFFSPTEVYRYNVDLEPGFTGTTLAVDTRDCCLVGDRWGASIVVPGTPRSESACGTGSTTHFTGLAHMGTSKHPLTTSATVLIYYCGGTDVFPGDVEVRIRYNGDGFTITPEGVTQAAA